MPSHNLLLAFLITTALFSFIPGPAMLYAAARTVAGGRRAGLMASLGIHVGGYVHVVVAAAGLSILFRAVPLLYTGVKLAGALYLIWLGIALFRTRADEGSTTQPVSGRRAFVQSILIEVLNPKTALFFVAFLPQFIDASAGAPVWVQFVALGTIVNLTFSIADVLCVMLASVVLSKLGRLGRAQRIAQRAGGSILVGLGARLAMQTG